MKIKLILLSILQLICVINAELEREFKVKLWDCSKELGDDVGLFAKQWAIDRGENIDYVVELLNRCIDLCPKLGLCWANLATCYYRIAPDAERALPYMRKAALLQPEQFSPALASMLNHQGSFEEARSKLEPIFSGAIKLEGRGMDLIIYTFQSKTEWAHANCKLATDEYTMRHCLDALKALEELTVDFVPSTFLNRVGGIQNVPEVAMLNQQAVSYLHMPKIFNMFT